MNFNYNSVVSIEENDDYMIQPQFMTKINVVVKNNDLSEKSGQPWY